jgi:hypothetical protein
MAINALGDPHRTLPGKWHERGRGRREG